MPGSSRTKTASIGSRSCDAAGSGRTAESRRNPLSGARIADRPEIIEQRIRLGDTMLGPAGAGGLATLVDRKSRITIVLKA